MSQFTENKWRCRHREWIGGHSGGRRGVGQVEKAPWTYGHYHV